MRLTDRQTDRQQETETEKATKSPIKTAADGRDAGSFAMIAHSAAWSGATCVLFVASGPGLRDGKLGSCPGPLQLGGAPQKQ